MASFVQKRLLTFLLPFALVVSGLVCQCPPSETAEHSHHAQTESEHCHGEEAHHQHGDQQPETHGHACLCNHDAQQAFVAQEVQPLVSVNFLIAVLAKARFILNDNQQALQCLSSTHSPPRSRPLYITQRSLLI